MQKVRTGACGYGGDGAAQHYGEDWEDPCWCHALEGQAFAGEEEVVLEDCCRECYGHVHPEEDAEGCDEPGAG